MLKKWIDEIRTQSDLYKSECWKYHLSGNVLELSILPIYQKEKELYRCSVIAVGQVLSALSKKIEEQNLNFHIQSFPSLENPEIVATIRTDEKGNFSNHNRLVDINLEDYQNLAKTLHELVEKHQFSLDKAKDFSKIDTGGDIPFKGYDAWYVISSAHNNPFTWLKVGYLKESLRNFSSHLPADSLATFDLCSDRQIHQVNLQISEHEYIQFVVGIQPENASTG